MFDATYGIEIECYLPEGETTANCAAALTRRLGSPVRAESYGHITQPHWKIVTDGSLEDYTRGIELVSPILSGPEGLEATAKIIEALNDFGCTVSRRCGLHVHVGAAGQPIQFFRNLYKLYAIYEPVIDAFMPPSRRQSASQWCRSITHLSLETVDNAPTLQSLTNRMSPNAGNARYHKLNLAAYQRHNTVEFRQHSGTLDVGKVTHWTKFCLRMVAAAKAGRLTVGGGEVTTRTQVNKAPYGSKAWQIGQLCLRPQGVTSEECLQVTGWRQISVPPNLRTCGLDFTTQRIGRTVRYYAQATAASSPDVNPTLDKLFDLLQCDDGERTYFRNRTANLSGSVQWAA